MYLCYFKISYKYTYIYNSHKKCFIAHFFFSVDSLSIFYLLLYCSFSIHLNLRRAISFPFSLSALSLSAYAHECGARRSPRSCAVCAPALPSVVSAQSLCREGDEITRYTCSHQQLPVASQLQLPVAFQLSNTQKQLSTRN